MTRIDEDELSRPPQEVLEILSKLGKGSYGSVYKARIKANGSIVAVKKVPVDSDLSDIVKEISIMQQCDSAHIVKCYGSLFDNQDLWICMEYCGAGSVADIMRLRNKTLNEEEIITILKFSLLGLEYLHKMRKIHRDIKAGNILLTENGKAKLADFGVAGQLSDTLAKRNTVIGTPYWMAPEVIQEIGYNCSADIWSLGITTIEMADGKPPLGDVHPMRALFMIASEPTPQFKKPHACPLIEEAQNIREKKASEPFNYNSKQVHNLNTAAAAQGSFDDSSKKDNQADTGTMIRHATKDVIDKNEMITGTLLSNSPGNSFGQMHGSLVGSEGQGTMVINASITDGEDLSEKSAPGLYGGTLTRSDIAAGAVAAAQRECGVSGSRKTPNQAPGNQRPFAAFSRVLRENGLEPGALNHLSYSDLEKQLVMIDEDLETELKNLTIRYMHKRQPLLDAITMKSMKTNLEAS